ncbi:synaptonemal complex protein 2 [Ochotona princeps]|uniref:synaptonemal complex protein 2 n=1 Tax=Ochotona princeps TaxID=9978 RepID=UPI0027147F98|nr:synaptonemal complex protein 2 [Ochotona princeps]
MPVKPDLQQLEKCIDDALRKNNFKPLDTLLQIDISEDVKIKCSKQFFHKLDDLICRELNKKDVQMVSAILASVAKCGKNITILGQCGLLTMMKQGLVQKMVTWFEKCKEIILSRGKSKDDAVLNMMEDLFDLLMITFDISDEGKRLVAESFIPQICALVADSGVNICVQQETLKKMNAMIDKMPKEARKIFSKQEMLILMSGMGERILDAGDYDLQVGIVEALCRMTTRKQRQELACQWFSMDFIVTAFKGIKESEFETDCRIFLNLVNGMLGDKRRVFTFPCLAAFLDKYELKIPSDEKLEEFWLDFNMESQSLSFYVAEDSEDHQWEPVTVSEDKVQTYSIEVRESKKLLNIILKNTIKISKREGKELFLYFDESLEISDVTKKIFGANKNGEFTRKQGISVAKTSVHILFDASGSQILVPESQISSVEEELPKEHGEPRPECANPLKPVRDSYQQDRSKKSRFKVMTPNKMKVSEASMIVPGADRYTVRSPVLLTNTTPRRGRCKPPLCVVPSAEEAGVSRTAKDGPEAMSLTSRPSQERNGGDNTDKYIKTATTVEKTKNKDIEFTKQNFNELQDGVPVSQAVGRGDDSVFSGIFDIYGDKMCSKLACWTPVTNIKICNKQRASALSDMFNEDIVDETFPKRRSSSSVSEDSVETEKVKCKKDVKHRAGRTEVGVCRSQQQQTHPKYSEHSNSENTKQGDWHIESATTFKSVLLNKTVEESLIYRKKYTLSKDVCDRSSSRKNVKSRRNSEKDLTSLDLKQKQRQKSKGQGLADAAESLISQINRRYKPQDGTRSARKGKEALLDSDFPGTSAVQHHKEKVQKKSYRKLETTFVNVTSEYPLNDVYTFNLCGADEPIIKLGVQEFQARETCADNSAKLGTLRNDDELEPSIKTKDRRVVRNQEKKSLFSDTDTEYRWDDSKTEVSWLKEPKSKPQLLDYSRTRKSRKSRPSLDKRQARSKMIDQQESSKHITRKVDLTVTDGRIRLPRRATRNKKNYKDLSNSESESEQELSDSFKEKLQGKEASIHSGAQSRKVPRKQQQVFPAETRRKRSKGRRASAGPKPPRGEPGLHSAPAAPSGSLSSVEVMRCDEKEAERDFTQECDYVTNSLSPCAKISSSESFNSNSGVGVSVNSAKKTLLCTDHSSSPLPQPSFLENHSSSPPSMSGEGREKTDTPCGTAHTAGPIQPLNRKRVHTDYLDNSNEEELGERENLLPKKLCKIESANRHSYKKSDNSSPSSVNGCFIPVENWEGLRKMDSECKKINIRNRKMDFFAKHSWKIIQQHLKTMSRQLQEHRLKKIDKFQVIINEELKSFEKDSQSLKDFEKEFAVFWEKLLQKYRTYRKSEQQRFQLLKASLDKHVFHSTDYEETIFTSEMCLMKENMKIVQDRLLQEMAKEELLHVRRGLMSLFMIHDKY